MALKWIIGSSLTGAISEANVLPVIASGDDVNQDVNAGDSTIITLSRADLPSDWRTYLKPFDKIVALVDPDVAFASGVLAAGIINKIDGKVKGVIKVQVALGLREYTAARIISNVYNTVDANPNSAITFSSNGPQGVMAAIINHCFSTTGIPSNAPKPPALLGTISGGLPAGTTYSFTAKNSDFMSYADALDKIRDTWVGGREYRFVPRWSSSAKTNIVFDAVIAPSTEPHIGENTTRTIQLADNTWKPLSFGQTASSDNLITRIIGQSKYGDTGTSTGSDFTSKTSTSATSILIDQVYNPGVELTASELDAQLTSRLAYNSTLVSEVTFERSYDTLADLRTMISYLGNIVNFTGTEQASQFGATMRIVGLSFSPEKRRIKVSLMPKAANYPVLPKDRNKNIGSDNGYNNSGGGNGVGVDTRTPVNPPPYVAPPFQMPGDKYTDSASILIPVDMRHFKGWNELSGDATNNQYSKANVTNFWHKQPDLGRSRINYSNGELIGLASSSRSLYGFDDTSGPVWSDSRQSRTINKYADGIYHNKDLDIFSIDVVGMFNSDSNPYMNRAASASPPADDFKKRIGTITYAQYSELEIAPEVFRANIPSSTNPDTRVFCSADYNMFCTQDFKTVYVQVMVTTYLSQVNSISQAEGLKAYSKTSSKLFRGTRGADGIIPSWEDLGGVFDIFKDTPNQKTFFSTAIYEINGQFHAFGAYLINKEENNVKAPTLFPGYELKFYSQGHTVVDVSNFNCNMVPIDLPGITMSESGPVNENVELRFKFPYAINVDYAQQKISLGVSRGANGKTSEYFSSLFSDMLRFTKIMSTDREISIKGTTDYNFVNPSVDESFRFRSKAPVFYKNNFFLFNATSVKNGAEVIAGAFKTKKIKHIRGKSGFQDTVSGELSFNDYNSYTNNTVNDKAKDAYVVFDNTASNANNLEAFGAYRWREVWYLYAPKTMYGMEYFFYNGYLYMICDTTFSEYEYTGDTSYQEGRGGWTKYRYWIGKFSINEAIL